MKLLVGGLPYKVKEKKIAEYGYWDMSSLEIIIKKGLPQELKEQTLIHEIQHAINDFCGFDNDEEITTRLANAWYQVLKLNKGVLDRLIE